MSDDNIIQMPTPLDALAKEIRAAYEQREHGREQWIEGTIKLGLKLAEARDRFPSNIAFGHWLLDNGLGQLGENSRATLITMAKEPILLRDALIEQEVELEPDTIWRKVGHRFGKLPKTPDLALPSAETDPNAPTEPVAPVSASPEAAENPAPANKRDYGVVGTANEQIRDASKAELVHMLGITVDEYRDFLSVYPWNRQRSLKREFAKMAAIKNKKRIARDLFHHGVDIVRTGKAPTLSNTRAFDARVFAPDVPEAITKFWQFEQVAKRLDRIILINAKAGEFRQLSPQQQHAEILHLWEHGAPLPPTVPRVVVIPENDSKSRIRHPVKFCGETLWPNNPSLRHVSYEDLNMGWHFAHHWLKYLEHAKPQKPNEILVMFGHMIQDLRAASSLQGITDVMTTCMSAYARRNGRKDKGDFDIMMAPGPPR